jgi:hypothetical protein
MSSYGNIMATGSDSLVGLILSDARESMSLNSGSKNSSFSGCISLGKYMFGNSIRMSGFSSFMRCDLTSKSSIEFSLGSSSGHFSSHGTKVDVCLLESYLLELYLFSHVFVSSRLGLVEGVDSIKERKIFEVGTS